MSSDIDQTVGTMESADEVMTVIDTVAQETEQPAPAGETPAEAFKRLAVPRVGAAIKRIQLIGNLSNRASYSYTEAQVAKVFAALRQEIDAAEKRFQPKVADAPAFSFDED